MEYLCGKMGIYILVVLLMEWNMVKVVGNQILIIIKVHGN